MVMIIVTSLIALPNKSKVDPKREKKASPIQYNGRKCITRGARVLFPT